MKGATKAMVAMNKVTPIAILSCLATYLQNGILLARPVIPPYDLFAMAFSSHQKLLLPMECHTNLSCTIRW